MSIKKTLFFALVLTIMAAYIFRYEMPRLEVEKEQAAPFAGITARAITSIDISRKESKFIFENKSVKMPTKDEKVTDGGFENIDSATWAVVGMPHVKLDQASLNSLVSSILELKLDKPLNKEEMSENLEVYGLSEPIVSMKISALRSMKCRRPV